MVDAGFFEKSATHSPDGVRPVNLRTDLADLANLIELVFRDTMDDNGRAAIREMRYLSQLGWGLSIIGRLNDMTLGIGMGHVFIQDSRLVGNVSVYPANWHHDLGIAWMIANVGVHPDYRGRGIARHLMHASMEMLRHKRADHAILQVDYDNTPAITLYESLGFIKERAFTTWTRSALVSAPTSTVTQPVHITHPRPSEWRTEYQLAQAQRPNEMGGMGWLKPLHESLFRTGMWGFLRQIFALSNMERLIVRSDDGSQILASLLFENTFGMSRTRLWMMNQGEMVFPYAEALLLNVLRRFSNSGFVVEHPQDDVQMAELLTRYRFRPHRTVWHMRYDFP